MENKIAIAMQKKINALEKLIREQDREIYFLKNNQTLKIDNVKANKIIEDLKKDLHYRDRLIYSLKEDLKRAREKK